MTEDGGLTEADEEGDAFPEGEIEDSPYFVEVWNDYDPSMRFVSVFPVGEEQGARASSVAYYIIEPGRHTGLHSDNAEEVIFVAEGDGELFMLGQTTRLTPATFVVIPQGTEHDIYAQGSVALRLLSFFPTTEILSSFQQMIFPVGGNVLSSQPPRLIVSELDANALSADFPFDLAEPGLSSEPRALTPSERLIGLSDDSEDTAAPENPPTREDADETL